MIRRLASWPLFSTITRAAWGIGDQALSSLTNFGLSISAAARLGTEAFGAFSIAFSVYIVALTVMRSFACDPMVIRYSGRPVDAWRVATRASTGSALLAGIVAGALSVAGGLVLGGSLGEALVILGLGLPGLLLQDAWRYAFFAAGRGRSAFLNDLAWTIALVIALVAVAMSGQRSIGIFVGAWALGGLAGALLGIGQAHVVPDPRRFRAWWHEHLDIAPRLGAEAVITSGAQPLTLSAIAIFTELVTVGTIRAGQVLMNAIHILTYGMQLFGVPEAVRMLQRSSTALIRMCVVLGAGLMGIALAWGAVLMLMPVEIGHALLGQTWDAARTVLLPVTIMAGASGLQTGAGIGLRALAATTRSLPARIVGSVAVTICAIVGAVTGGAVGGAWGFALGQSIAAGYWWYQFIRAVDDHQRRTDAADLTGRSAEIAAAALSVIEDGAST